MAIAMREKGIGITNLSHLISHAREAAYAIGRIGRPDICASSSAPGLNLKRGPRGPSGVMTGETVSRPSARERSRPAPPPAGVADALIRSQHNSPTNLAPR